MSILEIKINKKINVKNIIMDLFTGLKFLLRKKNRNKIIFVTLLFLLYLKRN